MEIQKKLLIIAVLVLMLLVGMVNIGYYSVTQEWEPDLTVFFWKKSPTFQIKFVNIATEHWGADWALTDENWQSVIGYCKYRLGINTKLEHPDDREICTRR